MGPDDAARKAHAKGAVRRGRRRVFDRNQRSLAPSLGRTQRATIGPSTPPLDYYCRTAPSALRFAAWTFLARGRECKGCHKDMWAGEFQYCDGSYSRATKSGCDWIGGSGDCTFPADRSVNNAQCAALCDADRRCHFYSSTSSGKCQLYFMTSCEQDSAGWTTSYELYAKGGAGAPYEWEDALGQEGVRAGGRFPR